MLINQYDKDNDKDNDYVHRHNELLSFALKSGSISDASVRASFYIQKYSFDSISSPRFDRDTIFEKF